MQIHVVVKSHAVVEKITVLDIVGADDGLRQKNPQPQRLHFTPEVVNGTED